MACSYQRHIFGRIFVRFKASAQVTKDSIEKAAKDITSLFPEGLERIQPYKICWLDLIITLKDQECSYLYSSDRLLPLTTQKPFFIYKMLELLDTIAPPDFHDSLARQQ